MSGAGDTLYHFGPSKKGLGVVKKGGTGNIGFLFGIGVRSRVPPLTRRIRFLRNKDLSSFIAPRVNANKGTIYYGASLAADGGRVLWLSGLCFEMSRTI
jgi:hypothetical protein